MEPNEQQQNTGGSPSPNEGGMAGGGIAGGVDPSAPTAPMGPEGASSRNMAMLAHLIGGLGHLVVPAFGWVAPLVIWMMKKEDDAYVADQGREALNFQITVSIAIVIAAISIFACIGVVLLPAVYIANLVFAIIASMATTKGEAYRYPFALRLVK